MLKRLGFLYLAKVPEFARFELQHGNSGFMHQRRRWMPGLYLLSEEYLNFRSVLLFDQWYHRAVNCVEHLLRKGTNVI